VGTACPPLAPARPALAAGETTNQRRSAEELGRRGRIRSGGSMPLTIPSGYARPLQGSEAAVFCLAPSGSGSDADGLRGHLLRSMQALAAVVGELPQAQPLLYTSSCSVYGNAAAAGRRTPPLQPVDRHGEILPANAKPCLFELPAAPAAASPSGGWGALMDPGGAAGRRFRSLAGRPAPGNGAAPHQLDHRGCRGGRPWPLARRPASMGCSTW